MTRPPRRKILDMDSHIIQAYDESGRPLVLNLSENWVQFPDGRRQDMGRQDVAFDRPLAMYASLYMMGAHDVAKGERVVKMDLGPADVHIDQALTNYATGFQREPGALIADDVCPIVPTDKLSDYYWQWNKDDIFELAKLAVAPGGNVEEVAPKQSNTTYSCRGYGLKTHLPAEVEGNSDNALLLAMRYMQVPLEKLRLGREVRVANMVLNSSNYASAYKETLAAGAKWNGGASSDPIKNIHDRQDAALKPLNRMVMGGATWRAFQRNAQVQKFIASKTESKPLAKTGDPNEWAAILNLPKIIVGEERVKTAASTYNTFVWEKHVALYHMPNSIPPMGQPISFNTFRWKGGTANGAAVEGGVAVRSFYDQTRGVQGGKTIVVYHYDHDVFVEDSVSGLIIDAYQA